MERQLAKSLPKSNAANEIADEGNRAVLCHRIQFGVTYETAQANCLHVDAAVSHIVPVLWSLDQLLALTNTALVKLCFHKVPAICTQVEIASGSMQWYNDNGFLQYTA